MEKLIRQSIFLGRLYPVFIRIKEKASRSVFAMLILSIMAWFGKMTDKSLLKHLITSESRTDKLFMSSRFYKVISAAANAVPRFLHFVYRKWERAMSESVIVYRLTQLGGLVPYLTCLTLLALLSIHHNNWNNMYSLVLSFAALLLLWLRNIRENGAGYISFEAIGLWPIVFAAVSVASAFWSVKFAESERFLFFTITCILIVLTCTASIQKDKQFSVLMLACAAGLIICSVYGFYQRFVIGIPASSSFTDLSLNANMPGRVYSFFDNPNAFANVTVFFTPLMLGLSIYTENRKLRAVYIFAFVVGILAMLMTYSRGAWLAFAVGLFVMLVIIRPKVIPAILIAGLLILPFLPENILNRFFTLFLGADSSINNRTYIYTAVYKIIRDNPITGVGLGTKVLKSVADGQKYYQASFPFVHAHSIYMEIWAESGIAAIISFLLTIAFAIKKGYKTVKSKHSSALQRGAAAGCIGGIIGSMVFGITDYAWSYPRVMALFWFLMAILYTAAKLSRENENA